MNIDVDKSETYQIGESEDGKGMFIFTDCGNRMYTLKGEMAYHGKLCPKCFMQNKYVTLYIRGSKEAIEYWKKKEELDKKEGDSK